MNHHDEPTETCTRRSALPRRGLVAVPCRYYTTFRTSVPAVPFIEVTVVAGSRKEAVQAAKQILAPVETRAVLGGRLMSATLEDLDDIACECEHCSGAAVDLVNINGKFACLECIAQWNGKQACDA